MKDEQEVARRDSVAWAAGVALARLDAQVGEPGRAVLRRRPALLAMVDQHAAQVRDTLADDDGSIAVTALAAYADGVFDVASARGVDPVAAAAAGRWDEPPWALVRLLAVCQLSASAQAVD
jgi:hypothetical protein